MSSRIAVTPRSRSPGKTAAPATLTREVWRQICGHLDGLAIGSTLAALEARGWFLPFAGKPAASMGELLANAPGNAGYLHVAMKALGDLGWLQAEGPPAEDSRRFILTPRGRAALDLAWRYEEAAAPWPLLAQGPQAWQHHGWRAADALDAWELLAAAMTRAWDLPADAPGLAEEIRPHLDAHLLAPLMTFLDQDGVLRSALAGDGRLNLDVRRLGRRFVRVAGTALRAIGWAGGRGRNLRLTQAGRIAARLAAVYAGAFAYVPLLGRARALLFGDAASRGARDSCQPENHLALPLDLAFSARVFDPSCRQPFLELLLPIFNEPPLARQPRALLDFGAGNGAMLAAALDAIRRRTRRGQALTRHPLTLVAVERSEAARLAAEQALRRLPVPGLAIAGDVDDPDALARRLPALGLRLDDCLTVSKSEVHSRGFSPPRRPGAAARRGSRSAAACVDAAGRPIPPALLEQSLAEHFARWRPHAARHGLLMLENHTTDPATAAQCLGLASVALLDITHGYSGQLLVEAEVHLDAARRAGFEPLALRRLGRDTLGFDSMTAAWWRPAGARQPRKRRSP